jgi:hypothetical protein
VQLKNNTHKIDEGNYNFRLLSGTFRVNVVKLISVRYLCIRPSSKKR